jgi:hypothetical protein
MKTDLDVNTSPIPEELLQRVEARGINRRDFILLSSARRPRLPWLCR